MYCIGMFSIRTKPVLSLLPDFMICQTTLSHKKQTLDQLTNTWNAILLFYCRLHIILNNVTISGLQNLKAECIKMLSRSQFTVTETKFQQKQRNFSIKTIFHTS